MKTKPIKLPKLIPKYREEDEYNLHLLCEAEFAEGNKWVEILYNGGGDEGFSELDSEGLVDQDSWSDLVPALTELVLPHWGGDGDDHGGRIVINTQRKEIMETASWAMEATYHLDLTNEEVLGWEDTNEPA